MRIEVILNTNVLLVRLLFTPFTLHWKYKCHCEYKCNFGPPPPSSHWVREYFEVNKNQFWFSLKFVLQQCYYCRDTFTAVASKLQWTSFKTLSLPAKLLLNKGNKNYKSVSEFPVAEKKENIEWISLHDWDPSSPPPLHSTPPGEPFYSNRRGKKKQKTICFTANVSVVCRITLPVWLNTVVFLFRLINIIILLSSSFSSLALWSIILPEELVVLTYESWEHGIQMSWYSQYTSSNQQRRSQQ